ncbi:infB, partial [Symbiodinium sp. KB8]
VKALILDNGDRVKEVPPGIPVKLLGMNGMPKAGDALIKVDSEQLAEKVVNG